MSTTALPYRIEERSRDGRVLSHVDYDDRESAVTTHDLWAHHVAASFTAARLPSPFGPHGDRRLVLLGPDRTVLPRTVTEGPEL
jgi:hypothetical protein